MFNNAKSTEEECLHARLHLRCPCLRLSFSTDLFGILISPCQQPCDASETEAAIATVLKQAIL